LNIIGTCYLLRQREEWIRFSYSNEDTKDEERSWVGGRRLNVVPGAKRAPLSQDHATTPSGLGTLELQKRYFAKPPGSYYLVPLLPHRYSTIPKASGR
jgi:hypothetical protein